MVWLVGALLLLWIAWGPAVLLAAAAALCIPRVRWWVQDRAHVDRRVAGWLTGAVVAVAAVVVVVPDGWLPVPPAPGVWSAPSYVGRPASATALPGAAPAQNPHRTAGDPTERTGPLGRQPEVDTGWFGLQRCGRLELTSTDGIVALCTSRSGEALRLIDPDSLRPTDTQDLPDRSDDSDCAGDAIYLDGTDRAIVAAGDRQVLAVTTSAKGEPALETDATWDLKPYVPYGDCVSALAPDWSGRIWWASAAGLVGTLDPAGGAVGVADLGEEVRRGISTDEGGAYVVTDAAVHRLTVGADGVPQPVWRTALGTAGSAAALVDGGVVAVADEVDDELEVTFLSRDDGRELCRQPVFEKGEGAAADDLAVVGSGVVVTNTEGYRSPRSTLLGFTTEAGLARVDLVEDGCVVSWTSGAVSPSAGAVLSRPNGLLYAWTKRPSLTGVSAWYLTGIDAATGRSMWSVRTGTGMLAGNDGSRVMLDRDGSAWLGTLSGLVRVHDRR